MSGRGSEEGTTEPERNAALETPPDEGEEQCPELIADELDSDDFDSDSADPPRRWRRANPHSQGLYEFTQERLVRSSPLGNQLVRESELKQQQSLKETLELSLIHI